MGNVTRRSFVAGAAASVAAARLHAQNSSPARVSLALPAQANGPRMPEHFAGLSYEVQQLRDPSFFSARNSGLVEQFKALSPNGVLRLGGNTSEYEWWKPTEGTQEPQHPQTRIVTGEPQALFYPVTAEAVRNLDTFLRATGWKCIYGIGLGTNIPQRAAEEAAFAAMTLGPRLLYFQLGNEVDLFAPHLRDPDHWSAQIYLGEWLACARAIAEAVPHAQFGMPDVASRLDWLTEIAKLWPSVRNPPKIAALTHHYYFGGPATNPAVNIPNLLSPQTMTKVQGMADIAKAAAKKMGVPLRMTEGNTCYRGGKPGVSDVFAAALWAADYSLLLAVNGYTGVNLHGGSGPSVANSVGGSLPGDALLRDEGATAEQIAAHPHPFYTPIASFGKQYVMEPVAYGLKFAGMMSGGTFVESDLTARLQDAGVDATGYAAKMPDESTRVILLNKDVSRDAAIDLNFGVAGRGAVEIDMLHAPALDSRSAAITRSGSAQLRHGIYSTMVQHASGVCLTFRPA